MDTRSRILRWLVIIFCLYLIVTTVQGILELLKAGDKVTEREKRLAALEDEKRKLLADTTKSGTLEYLEQAVYDKLGMSRLGEKVVIIPQELLATPGQAVSEPSEENWKKWWKLVF